MLEQNKLQKGMDQIYVKEAWGEVMGKGVMNYTESVTLKNHTIFVKLASSALREELEYGKDKIVKFCLGGGHLRLGRGGSTESGKAHFFRFGF